MAHATSEEEVEEYDREKLGEELEYDFWDLLRARDKAKKSLKKYEAQLLQLVLSGVPLERAPPADNDKANTNAKDDDEDEDDDDEDDDDDDTVADARAYREDRGKKADKNRDRSRSPCARLSRAQRATSQKASQKGSRSGSASASAPSERDQAWARSRPAGYYCS